VLVLGIDTATSQVSVALGDQGRVLGEISLVGGRRHAEQLAPAIRYLCSELDVSLSQLAAIAVDVGPGLFTGLRVGVTTAKVMAQALRLPVVGIVSLDLVAYPLRHTNRLIVSVLDARRGEVFCASYRPVPGGVQRFGGYDVRPPAELVADLEVGTDEILLAGDGVDVARAAFAGIDHADLAGPDHAAPSVAALVELAAARVEREEFEPPGDLRPLYLRTSDAEINWDVARAGGRWSGKHE
jgi:tRNA threonylcarbamoyladenosine biosynthesis protein TsaB